MRKVGIVAAALVKIGDQHWSAAAPSSRRRKRNRGARRCPERQRIDDLYRARVSGAEVLHFDFELADPLVTGDRTFFVRSGLLELEVAQGRQLRAICNLARKNHRGFGFVVCGVGVLIRAACRFNDLCLVRRLAAEVRRYVLGNLDDHVKLYSLTRRKRDGPCGARVIRRGAWTVP